MTFANLFEFTDAGVLAFERAFTGQIPEDVIDLHDPAVVSVVPGTKPFDVRQFTTAHELAEAILGALGSRSLQELLPNLGLWAWLTFVLRDVVFPLDKAGVRALGEVHRWYPSNPNDFWKAQRHLVRMPVTLLATLGRNADHLLCGLPSVHGEIREQLTSQQAMFHPAFQGAARALYYDDAGKKLKRGTGVKTGGSPRRLAKVRKQFDVTWDLFALSSDRLIEMLPNEFDRFRPAPGSQPKSGSAITEASLRGVEIVH